MNKRALTDKEVILYHLKSVLENNDFWGKKWVTIEGNTAHLYETVSFDSFSSKLCKLSITPVSPEKMKIQWKSTYYEYDDAEELNSFSEVIEKDDTIWKDIENAYKKVFPQSGYWIDSWGNFQFHVKDKCQKRKVNIPKYPEEVYLYLWIESMKNLLIRDTLVSYGNCLSDTEHKILVFPFKDTFRIHRRGYTVTIKPQHNILHRISYILLSYAYYLAFPYDTQNERHLSTIFKFYEKPSRIVYDVSQIYAFLNIKYRGFFEKAFEEYLRIMVAYTKWVGNWHISPPSWKWYWEKFEEEKQETLRVSYIALMLEKWGVKRSTFWKRMESAKEQSEKENTSNLLIKGYREYEKLPYKEATSL